MTSEIQFAFKEKHSTNMCTTIIKEVTSHYNANGSNVYMCMLDATKVLIGFVMTNFFVCLKKDNCLSLF